MSHTILIVEDEQRLAELMGDYLSQAEFQHHWIENGLDVTDWVAKHNPDLVLLDLMLPGKDGITICKELRAFTEIPIIMVTAKVEEIDRLLGLEMGADDYVCKPFSYREVILRIKALLKRTNHKSSPLQQSGGIQLDESGHSIQMNDQSIELTAIEFQLLKKLMNRPGTIFSRDQLMDTIYPDRRIVSDRTIDSHIKKLRKKLAKLLPDQEVIHSVYSVGYKYVPIDG